jgi:hypothetical protein
LGINFEVFVEIPTISRLEELNMATNMHNIQMVIQEPLDVVVISKKERLLLDDDESVW